MRKYGLCRTICIGILPRHAQAPHLLPSVFLCNLATSLHTSRSLQPSQLDGRRFLPQASESSQTPSGRSLRERNGTCTTLTVDLRRLHTLFFANASRPLSGRGAFDISTRRKMEAPNISYLTQKQAQQLDADLMGPVVGYSVDQLMELAGLSVAQAVADFFHCSSFSSPPAENTSAAISKTTKQILVACGPGNNGGDGLVAARHLKHFGFSVETWYPKPGGKELYTNLVKQLEQHGVAVLQQEPTDFSKYALLVDAVFGFSFTGALRPPFDAVLQRMKQSNVPVVAVDVPSGWDVEHGDTAGDGLKPVCLVSLTAPKLFAKNLKMAHYVGGRFVPATLVEKYNLVLPTWPGTQQIVRIR